MHFNTQSRKPCYLTNLCLSDHITITPKDPQWVGAWWLGYLIAGLLSLLAAVPFWCLPKTLPRSQSIEDSRSSSEKSRFIIDDSVNYQMAPGEEMKIMEMARSKSYSPWSWAHIHLPSRTWGRVRITTFGSCLKEKLRNHYRKQKWRGEVFLIENVIQVDEQESAYFPFRWRHPLSHTIVLLHSSFSV